MKSNKLLKMISGTYLQIDAETHFAPLNITVRSIVNLRLNSVHSVTTSHIYSLYDSIVMYMRSFYSENRNRSLFNGADTLDGVDG